MRAGEKDLPWNRLPGGDLVQQGLKDLAQGVLSEPALLVSIGAPRLRREGFAIPLILDNPEHRLYFMLAAQHGNAAHSRYNALVRKLVSFEHSLPCAT